MLYFDRIEVFEGIDINSIKDGGAKKAIHQFFLCNF